MDEREKRWEQQTAAYRNQQKQIKEAREFSDRFRQVASRASQAMNKLKEIERHGVGRKADHAEAPFRLQIPQPPRSGQRVIGLEGPVTWPTASTWFTANLDL